MSQAAEAAEARARGGLFDLSDRAKFSLTGADRVRYLNGQVSQAVKDLGPAETRAACIMTAKGRLNGYVHFCAVGDALLLDAAAAQREELAARLERYIIADDVELRDVTDDYALYHIFGGRAEEISLSGAEAKDAARFHHPGADVWVPRASAASVLAELAKRWTPCAPDTVELLRIEQGVPAWGAELDERTIPVEAGLDRGAIDYHKGCYIGQEVISRLKSIGHVNRQLRGLRAVDEGNLAAGMTLSTPDGQPAGGLTSAAHSFALAGSIALGYVRRGVSSASLLARSPDSDPTGPAVAVAVCDLPFPT